jgi:hypothetical protein
MKWYKEAELVMWFYKAHLLFRLSDWGVLRVR